jgi:hypothetical protein
VKLIIALLLTAAALTAQTKPAPAPPATPPAAQPTATFSELANSRILIAYHKALEAQIQAGLAQQSAKDASDRYSAVVATEVKAAGLPAGTQVNVQIATDTVTPVPPPAPAKEAEKPTAKK